MALTSCNDCGGEVSEEARACPHCGYPGTKNERVNIEAVDIPFGEMVGLILKFWLASIPALLILAVLGAVAMTFLAGLGGAMGG